MVCEKITPMFCQAFILKIRKSFAQIGFLAGLFLTRIMLAIIKYPSIIIHQSVNPPLFLRPMTSKIVEIACQDFRFFRGHYNPDSINDILCCHYYLACLSEYFLFIGKSICWSIKEERCPVHFRMNTENGHLRTQASVSWDFRHCNVKCNNYKL